MSSVPRLMLISSQIGTQFGMPDLAEQAIAGGVDTVQLRDPDLHHTQLREAALAIVERLGSPNQLTVNNDLELAAELACGLHLPERSDQLLAARARLGTSSIIGRSVHSPESAAASGDVDYIIAGHVFATASKPGLTPIGLEGLAAIVTSSSVPVLAVGSITAERVPEVIATGAHGVAVIRSIANAFNPRAAAARLRRQIDASLKEHMRVSDTDPSKLPITLTVNGKSLAVPSGSSIADLLQLRQLDQRLVAVEHNRSIVPPANFASALLADGDDVEIVHFVGGG